MSNRDDRTVDIEGGGEISEIDDAIGKGSGNPRTLRISHIQLINGDDSYVTRCLLNELPPQIRPCRIAMHAQQRDLGLARAIAPRVKEMPLSLDTLGVDCASSA